MAENPVRCWDRVVRCWSCDVSKLSDGRARCLAGPDRVSGRAEVVVRFGLGCSGGECPGLWWLVLSSPVLVEREGAVALAEGRRRR